MEAATDLAGDVIAKAQGRKTSDGTEAPIKVKPLKDAWTDLYALKVKLETAKDKYNDAKKAVAEKSGFQAAVITKAINAQFRDRVEESKRDTDQLSIVLNEVVSIQVK